MDFSHLDFISIDNLLGDIGVSVNDQSYNRGLDKGWYVSRLHRAIQDLAISTFYDTQTKDIFDWFNGNDLNYPIPANCFNIKEIYLFNGECKNETCSGSCCDTCEKRYDSARSVKVHWKPTYRNNGESGITTANINKDNRDSVDTGFYTKHHYFSGNTYYGNLQNGLMMFSDSCKNYSHIRIVYSGMGAAEDETEPSVPRILSRVIHDRVKMEAFQAIATREKTPAARADYMDAKEEYYGNGRTIKGSKLEAESLLKKMSAWERKSYNDYLQSPSYR